METENDLAFCQIPDTPDEARGRLERLLAAGHNPTLTTANLVSCAVFALDRTPALQRLDELRAMDLSDCPGMWLWSTKAPDAPGVSFIGADDLLSHLERETSSLD